MKVISLKEIKNKLKMYETTQDKLLKIYKDYDSLYFLTPFYEGGSLQNYLDEGYQFSDEQIKYIVSMIVIAIQHLHSYNVAYRHLDPQYIYFNKQGYLVLKSFEPAK